MHFMACLSSQLTFYFCLSLFAAGLSTSQLRVIPRHPFTGISLRAIALFKISVSEVKKIRKTERLLDPKVILPKY